MTARTSPAWDNNPNHKPDPMNLHHTGAYSLPPIDANVNVDVNVPVVPTLNLKKNGQPPSWDHNPNNKPDPMNLSEV
jgi:hypothetical protein